ncbi:hypothetical protein BJF83_11525 [Nocardiopsis sp. CNR-923]|uniref:DUF885 family protein n=1 Tax=Nocardiopsis sp. CNR-923 TaxID=1904965 RepID=UPI00095FC95F|nr:DUF885 family protein [Nocardiopsis sp. CNR-923]OLT29372.1 hypothetical protein BJF83_11525 [Nocardiopsis sp. CNR-923]
MRHTDFQIAVQAGDGLIGRFPTGVMLLVGDGAAEASDRLIELFDDAASAGVDPAANLEERFGASDAPDVSAFGTMVESDGGTSLTEFLEFTVLRGRSWPAQALAYACGERVWHDAREDARHHAGRAFGQRAFHARMLTIGPCGLSLLAEEARRPARNAEPTAT